MKYRGIFEYEYPTEHKPPVSIDVYLHGDCVKGKIIEWEYRPLEQEPIKPTIESRPVIHANWLSGDCKGAHCSNCEEYTPFVYGAYNFCPNCGAKMETRIEEVEE